MPRFTCQHQTTSLIKHVTPSGKVIAFDYRGVLDTDEEVAAVIRAHPLYGRLILDGDESAPTHGEVPALETPPMVVRERERPARQPAGSRMDPPGAMVECLACGKLFVQKSWTPRLYCDGACRTRAYRARRGAGSRLGDERLGLRLERRPKAAEPLKKAPKPVFANGMSRTNAR